MDTFPNLRTKTANNIGKIALGKSNFISKSKRVLLLDILTTKGIKGIQGYKVFLQENVFKDQRHSRNYLVDIQKNVYDYDITQGFPILVRYNTIINS
jgi:hypothetical protein